MSQGHHGNTAGHFSGAGAAGKPLASKTCQSLPADCAFPSEPVASRAALRLTHRAGARCDVIRMPCMDPMHFGVLHPPFNFSPPPLVLEGVATGARTWLLLVRRSRTQIFSVPCGMLEM